MYIRQKPIQINGFIWTLCDIVHEGEGGIHLPFSFLFIHFLGKVDYMQIQKKVNVKQIITETSKLALREKFADEINQLERECQQLLFEQRKLTNKVKNKQKVEQRFQSEVNQRKDRITIVQFKLEQLELLEIGQEIIEKEIDGIVNVEVGMDWKEIEQQTSIVIQDNQVIRIDQT